MHGGQDADADIDPTAYAAMFEGSRVIPATISGVCGRIVRGRREADFAMLSYASGRRLAWVTGADGLHAMLGRPPADIVRGIGKDAAWLREKLAEGMRWKLIVLPQAVCERADWRGVFAMIKREYPEVAGKLNRWHGSMQDVGLAASIDPASVTAAIKDDPEHPVHIGVERYRTCEDTRINARLFLWHALGLNQHFIGDGWAVDPLSGQRISEYLTANVALADVPSHCVLDLDVEAGLAAHGP